MTTGNEGKPATYTCGNCGEQVEVPCGACRSNVLAVTALDPEAMPVSWGEWDLLDGEEKGATLEDYFRVVSELTGRSSEVTKGCNRAVV